MKKVVLSVSLLFGVFVFAQKTTKDSITTKQIKEVTLTKKAFEQKSDRFIYNVANSPIAKGNTAFSLLKETPLISSTDDKTLKIAGKSNAVIYINGKKTRMNQDALIAFLKSMPAENIQKIEVITMPGSEYDVESSDGIINIILKKKIDNGWNGNLLMTNEQTYYNEPSASASLNFRYNKLGINANFNSNQSGEHQYYILRNGNQTSSNQSEGATDFHSNGLGGYLNLDYAFNDKNSLALSYNNWFSRSPNGGVNLFNTISYLDDNQHPVQSFSRTKSNENDHSANNSFNLNYELKTDSLGSKLNLNSAYLTYSDRQQNINNTLGANRDGSVIQQNDSDQILNQIRQITPQSINNFSEMVDYVQKFKNNFTLSGGAHFNHTKTDNNLQSFTTNFDPSTDQNSTTTNPDHFIYFENVFGFYMTADKNFGNKISTKLGVRYELTNSNAKSLNSNDPEFRDIKRSYKNFLPYFSLNYAINQNHNLSYAFSSRVRRPSFWEINPVRQYLTQYNYLQNNPFVKASSNYNQQLTYMYKSAYFLILGYNIKKNNIQQIPLQRPLDIEVAKTDANGNPILNPTTGTPETMTTTINELRYIRTNFGTTKTLSLSLGVQKSFFNNYWNLNSTLNLGRQKVNGSLDTDPITGEKFVPYVNQTSRNTYFIQINNTIRLDAQKTWYAQVNFWHAGKQQIEIGILNPLSDLDLSLKKIWKDWTFSATATDLLNSQNITINQPSGNENFNYVHSRQYKRGLEISISYNFGNQKVKGVRKIKTATEDIKSRTK